MTKQTMNAAAAIILCGTAIASLPACKDQPQSASTSAPQTPLVEVKVSQLHMGMLVELIVWAPSQQTGEDACAKAFERIKALNQIFSDYEPESELSRLCRRGGENPVEISPELYEVLSAGRTYSELTNGRYDITAGAIIRVWRQARREKKVPAAEGIARARLQSGYEKLTLTTNSRAALSKGGILIDLGSIAKGYIGDEAISTLREIGFPHAAFIAGGDMVFGDPPPHQAGWLVKPAHPQMAEMRLSNCGFSVSGDTVQFFEAGGVRYSHCIDALSGQALTDRRMCIVIAPKGAVSDPLSTIGTILPEGEFDEVVRRVAPGAKKWVFKAQ